MDGSSHFCSSEELARRVHGALSRFEDAIAMLGADCSAIDFTALEAPPDKVIAETAIFLHTATAVPERVAAGVSARAHELLQALIPFARHLRVAVSIAFQPALARDYAIAHTMLTAAGYPDPAFAQLLAAATRAPAAAGRERVPHRELEQCWLAWLSGGRPPPPELIARTALGRGLDLLSGSRDDIYALTHALMYGGDFGSRRGWHQPVWHSSLAMVRSALAGALDDDDFDLAGELLLAWPLLEAEWDDIGSLGYAVLSHLEDKAGVHPSLALRQAEYAQQHYLAAMTYHTTYVIGLLCAVLLQRSARPTRPDDGPAAISGDRSGSVISLAARSPNNRAIPRSCSTSQCGGRCGVLTWRACKASSSALHYNVALSPRCTQAGSILQRIAGSPLIFTQSAPPAVPIALERIAP
jgi:hypothetical protein